MDAAPPRVLRPPELAISSVLPLKGVPSAPLVAPPHRPPPRRSLRASCLRSSLLPADDVIGEDVLRAFLTERELHGDAISKASDRLWSWGASNIFDTEDDDAQASINLFEESSSVEENDGGYLKLTKTREWILGDNAAPLNKKLTAKDWQNDSEVRKKINVLKYEALKRELMFLTAGVGAACCGYCSVALSMEAAVSYAFGVLLSCVYLHLLCRHVDSLSKEAVPPIFMQKKQKKIGIRSEDLKQSVEQILSGSGVALSSPRLVIPATVYGLWALSNNIFGDDFHFQIVPAMLGFFAYKATALVQVYRDNEDLKLIFPDSDGGPVDG